MIHTLAIGLPLVALLVGAILYETGLALSAAIWLGACLLLVAVYHSYFLSRLNYWAGLPSKREVPIGVGVWRRPFDRLARAAHQEASEQSEVGAELARLRSAVDRLPDGLLLLDRFNHIEWANRTARDLLGIFGSQRPVHHFLNQPDFVESLDSGRFGRPLQLKLPGHPGRSFEIQLHASDEARKLIIVRDISEQAMLDAMRSDFVANVSHEIRTPITVIGGFAETLLELDLSAEERRQYIEAIARHSHTMQHLVDDLLTLSTLESGTDRPPDEPIDLDELSTMLVAETQALSAGQHTVTSTIPPGLKLLGVRRDIVNALRNLLTNAVRHTPAGGQITLEWVEKKGRYGLSVVDTGMGIPAAHLPRLTERFYRVDRARSRGTGGTGLGLAIVKHVANRHGAEFLIQSELGKGSRFTLRFASTRVIRPEFVPSPDSSSEAAS